MIQKGTLVISEIYKIIRPKLKTELSTVFIIAYVKHLYVQL